MRCVQCGAITRVPEEATAVEPPSENHVPEPSPEAAGPRPRFGTPAAVVPGCIVVLALVLMRFGSGGDVDRLERPAELAALFFERSLTDELLFGEMSAWKKKLVELLGLRADEVLGEAIEAYQEIAASAPPDSAPRRAALRARLVVALAEAGRMDEARAALDDLDLDLEEARAERFRNTVLFAYPALGTGPVAPPVEPELSVLHPAGTAFERTAWSRNRLAARFALQSGRTAEAQRLDARLRERAKDREFLWLLIPIEMGVTFSLAIVVLAAWLRAGRPSPRLARAPIPAAWFTTDGFAVLFWGLILSAIVMLLLTVVLVGMGATFVRIAEPFAEIAVVVLVHRFLLRPRRLTFWRGFGLLPVRSARMRLLGVCVLLLALDGVDTLLVVLGSERFGAAAAWHELLIEPLLLGSRAEMLAMFLVIGAWAPFVEELLVRGLFYATLRRHMGVVPALLVSGITFGALHQYSIPGILLITASGIWWALAYEKTRSLLPGIIVHAVGNTVSVVSVALWYR
ncbi:MAG: lysostaphin resistance A-like protein [Candidatus Krumholzibacteriia bacterium]